jgi:hypothetical protein
MAACAAARFSCKAQPLGGIRRKVRGESLDASLVGARAWAMPPTSCSPSPHWQRCGSRESCVLPPPLPTVGSNGCSLRWPLPRSIVPVEGRPPKSLSRCAAATNRPRRSRGTLATSACHPPAQQSPRPPTRTGDAEKLGRFTIEKLADDTEVRESVSGRVGIGLVQTIRGWRRGASDV